MAKKWRLEPFGTAQSVCGNLEATLLEDNIEPILSVMMHYAPKFYETF